MALGDYTKTTFANGVSPAINATNLNNNENKTKELDTAVAGIDSDVTTLETITTMPESSILIFKRKIILGVI